MSTVVDTLVSPSFLSSAGQLSETEEPWILGLRECSLHAPMYSSTNLDVVSNVADSPTSLLQIESPSHSLSAFGRTKHEYENEDLRKKTYNLAPHSVLRKADALLKAGFYYTGEKDVVQCYACGVQVGEWIDNDLTPLARHEDKSPHCPLLSQLCKKTKTTKTMSTTNSSSPREHMGSMKIQCNREKTFRNWPRDAKLKPDDVIAAGMYYAEESQHVICPYCGLKSLLVDLQTDNNASYHHSNKSPNCPFVKENLTNNDDQKKRWSWRAEPAVVALLELGVREQLVQRAAFRLRRQLNGETMLASNLLEVVHQMQDDKTQIVEASNVTAPNDAVLCYQTTIVANADARMIFNNCGTKTHGCVLERTAFCATVRAQTC